MSVGFSVLLSDIVENMHLNEIYLAENYKDTKIATVEINSTGA